MGAKVSFARSADILKRLAGGTTSAESVRRALAKQASQVVLPEPVAGQTVLVDATKAKADSKERGEPVSLVITAEPGPFTHRRPTRRKQLVHLHVGNAKPLKRHLKAMGTHVVHDDVKAWLGVPLISIAAVGIWTPIKTLLMKGWRPSFYRRSIQRNDILGDWKDSPQRYSRRQTNLKSQGLANTAGHLQKTSEEAFTYIKELFSNINTSRIEREM